MRSLTFFLLFLSLAANAQNRGINPSPFVYQGELRVAGIPANGPYDFQLQLFSNAGGGASMGTELVDSVGVVDGVFTLPLDFGVAFDNQPMLYLEISVRDAGGGAYTLLSPRQRITPTPYSHTAMSVSDDGVDTFAIEDGTIRDQDVDSGDIQLRVTGTCPVGNAIRSIDNTGGVTCQVAGAGGGDAWNLAGNSGTTAGTDFLGTTDDTALDLRTNNQRAMRYEWGFSGTGSPNVIGGHANNSIPDTDEASVIAGGGVAAAPNAITASYAFVGGGIDNQVSGNYGSIPGGSSNRVTGAYSFAAGRSAQANHNNTFVWNDGGTFASTADDQFLIDAGGGVGIGLNNPSDYVHINAPGGQNAFRIQVAGTTRLRVYDNGGVSVGGNNTPPAGGLRVLGQIQTDGDVTRWEMLAAGDFQELEASSDWRNDFGYVSGGDFLASNGSEFSASVNLPLGAVITELRARVLDNYSGGNLTVLLKRFTIDGSGSLMADDGTTGTSSSTQTLLDTSIANETVDNENFAYVVEIDMPSGSSTTNARVYGVRITYTIDSVYH